MISALRIEVSFGELLDRLTILDLKAERLFTATAREAAVREALALRATWAESGLSSAFGAPEEQLEWRPLSEVNARLWTVEEALRRAEAFQRFDEDFVALAREVYFRNDERAALKRALNARLGSPLAEQKSYPDYRGPGQQL